MTLAKQPVKALCRFGRAYQPNGIRRGHGQGERSWGTIMARGDDEPLQRPRARLERLSLDLLGIEELNAYIDELRAEIARAEADIARKQGHRSAADEFFRKP